MNEFTKSFQEYKTGTIIEDDTTKVIYEVVNCVKENDHFRVELKQHKNNNTQEIFEQLKEVLNTVKMHDKDLFMLTNIVSTLEDSVNE